MNKSITALAAITFIGAVTSCSSGANMVNQDDLKPHPKNGQQEFQAVDSTGLVLAPVTVPPDTYMRPVTAMANREKAPTLAATKSLYYELAGTDWSIGICTATPANITTECTVEPNTKALRGTTSNVAYVAWSTSNPTEQPPQWAGTLTPTWRTLQWLSRMQEGKLPSDAE